ncbi:hypothetical protein FHR74_003709, partial [Sphingomonas aerolata]|nr:hypothetical protein [Sphingomonas aerolata]
WGWALEGCHRSERPHGLVAAVANNQMLQAFREGGYASVGIFVGYLTL